MTGYNNAFFDGDAKIISQLNYVGREMSVKGIDKRAFRYCTFYCFFIKTGGGENIFV